MLPPSEDDASKSVLRHAMAPAAAAADAGEESWSSPLDVYLTSSESQQTAMALAGSLLALAVLGLLALYAACLACALRGELDLVTDEETGRPTHTARFVNPFKRRRRDRKVPERDASQGA